MPAQHRRGLTWRIVGASAVFATLGVAVLALLLTTIREQRSASRLARHSEEVLAVTNNVEKLVVDLETGTRGYLLTGQERFLEPWYAAQQALPGQLLRLEHLVTPTPAETATARSIRSAVRAFLYRYSVPHVARAHRDLAAARGIAASGEGDRRVDVIRGHVAELRATETALGDARRARAESTAHRAIVLGVAAIPVFLGLVVLFAIYLVGAVVRPLRRAACAADRLAEGDLSIRLGAGGVGEVGRLASAFDRMAGSLAESQAELQARRDELGAVLDATPDAIRLVDLGGRTLVANAAAEELLALRPDESLYDRLEGMAEETEDPDAFRASSRALLANPARETIDDFRLVRRARSFRRYSAPVRDSSGALHGRIFVTRDVTAEREGERLKGEFVALVSHELRTPLTAIMGYLELVADGEDNLTDEQRRFLDIAARNGERLLRLVGDLLFIASVEAERLALDLDTVDLQAVAAECLEASRPVAEEYGVDLRLEAGEVSPLVGDRARLAQLLDNLVSNAVKFTGEGGEVVVRLATEKGRAVIEVSDTGIGIPEEEQGRLFERFFRASGATEHAVQGTGLGLTIAKGIVDAHEGSISFTSEPGQGTTFRVELPLRTPPRRAVPDAAATATRRSHPTKSSRPRRRRGRTSSG